MKKEESYGKISLTIRLIMITVILIVISLGEAVWNKHSGKPFLKPKQTAPRKTGEVSSEKPPLELITITKEWSENITLGQVKDGDLGFKRLSNKVEYWVRYNGGEENGGWDAHVPGPKVTSPKGEKIAYVSIKIEDWCKVSEGRIRVSRTPGK